MVAPPSKKPWIEKFRRETSSLNYLPEIDGLRFLAIFWVVILMHTTHFIDEKFFSNALFRSDYWRNFSMEGGHGVTLFFMISGFILSLPFARMHLGREGAKKISLRRYYIRRLVRLEPPYIIALTLFFVGYVWVLKDYGFNELFPHFLASLFYSHLLVFNEFPWVLPVAWSLEMEVQFYILAPLLSMVYLIKQNYIRWSLFLAVTVASGVYNYYFITPSLPKFMCFFALGMLLTDLYCNKVKLLASAALCTWIGGAIFIAIWFIPSINNFPGYVIKLIMMASLFYIVLTNDIIRNLFSNRYLTLIGGMCYSIYLLHFAILSCIGRVIKMGFDSTPNVFLIPVFYLVFALIILLGSALYFIAVEKPFMRWNTGRSKSVLPKTIA